MYHLNFKMYQNKLTPGSFFILRGFKHATSGTNGLHRTIGLKLLVMCLLYDLFDYCATDHVTVVRYTSLISHGFVLIQKIVSIFYGLL